LILRAAILERDWDMIARRFAAGDKIIYKVRIKLICESEKIVAVSDFVYWARNSSSLRQTGASLSTTHHMLAHKLHTSARLIAGLRAGISNTYGSPIDPFAERAAGSQGMTMAQKFSLDTPQLFSLVKARTLSCGRHLSIFAQNNPNCIVINIGVGLDARPWRMTDLHGARFIELDLPVMLKERAVALPPIDEAHYSVSRVPFDLLADDLSDVLQKVDFPATAPKFIIWEGGSMYFSQDDARLLLSSIKSIMCSQSVLWLDCITEDVVHDRTGDDKVRAFVDNMRMIGEPFVAGLAEFDFDAVGLSRTVKETAAGYVTDSDPIFGHYYFMTCSN
jgi:O-methyltransferase involved in polyketide biosynthesis